MDIVQLILLVQENPAIYDPSHPKHRDRDAIAAIWKSISQSMKSTDERVKTKWHNLRSNYMRERRKLKQPLSGSVAMKKISWPFFKQMHFLGASLQQTLSSANVPEPEDQELEENIIKTEENLAVSEEVEDIPGASNVEEIRPTHTKKRRVLKTGKGDAIDMENLQQFKAINKSVEDNTDSDRLFLLSLLPLVKQLSPYHNLEFRTEVMALLKHKLYPQQPVGIMSWGYPESNLSVSSESRLSTNASPDGNVHN